MLHAVQRGVERAGGRVAPSPLGDFIEDADAVCVISKTDGCEENDLFEANFKEATVVTLFLLPNINLKLRPKLFRDLKPGTRIVSHSFDMGSWEPEKRIEVESRYLYLWRIPKTPPPLKDGE